MTPYLFFIAGLLQLLLEVIDVVGCRHVRNLVFKYISKNLNAALRSVDWNKVNNRPFSR